MCNKIEKLPGSQSIHMIALHECIFQSIILNQENKNGRERNFESNKRHVRPTFPNILLLLIYEISVIVICNWPDFLDDNIENQSFSSLIYTSSLTKRRNFLGRTNNSSSTSKVDRIFGNLNRWAHAQPSKLSDQRGCVRKLFVSIIFWVIDI